MHGQDLNISRPQSVNNSIIAKKDFSIACIIYFRNDPAGLWKGRQAISRIECSLSEHHGKWRRVSRYEEANRLEIVQSLGRPLYFSHFAIRWRASSWLISSPASACWIPLSIL